MSARKKGLSSGPVIPIPLEPPVFITPAFAQGTAAAPGAGSIFIQLIPFILIFVIMYFLLIRPQQKRQKAHQKCSRTSAAATRWCSVAA